LLIVINGISYAQFATFDPIIRKSPSTPNLDIINAISAKNSACLDYITQLQSEILDIKAEVNNSEVRKILDKYYEKLARYKFHGEMLYMYEDELGQIPLSLKKELTDLEANRNKPTGNKLKSEISNYNCYKVVKKTSLGLEKSQDADFEVSIEEKYNSSYIRLKKPTGQINITLDPSSREYQDGFIIIDGKINNSQVTVILQNLENGVLIVSLKQAGEMNSYCCTPL
jgi:hypothetical protein